MILQADAEKLLWRLGLSRSYLGFTYAASATEILGADRHVLQYIHKGLYLPVALKYRTSEKCVERNIRTAIRVIWDNGNRDLLIRISEKELEQKPNNREFLDILVEYLDTVHIFEEDLDELK